MPVSLSDPHTARTWIITLVLLALPTTDLQASPLTISIDVSEKALSQPATYLAVADTADLLRRSLHHGVVRHNAPSCRVRIRLPDVATNRNSCIPDRPERPYPCTAVPDPSYRWRSRSRAGGVTLTLEARTPEGVAAGLYGLLQEKLGFSFYHPRESIVPSLKNWPLPDSFSLAGSPRFEKRGFHLHSLHPIELTEQLHDPSYPGALLEVREYIDWLARNGQNTFQFFLLREIDRKNWPPHARHIVEYAHRRGIRCGVEISLSMIQQQAFQAITLLRFYPTYTRQIDDTLAWLFQAPWDYVSLDVSMGEHLPILDRMLPKVQRHVEQQVEKRYGAKLLYATHVICPDKGEKVRRPQLPGSGIMIHTVMCYSATDSKAPVYGNRNQRFMLEAAINENRRRETWYWPESSYWVGFDSSVPLLLLSYLDARWNDMETMSRVGVTGHLTFTSGWELGYWLIDWSIARWSWSLKDNGSERPVSPLSRLADLYHDRELRTLMEQALSLQNHYLKEKELLRFMSALTPFSELPHPFDKPFQPEPDFSYRWLLNVATPAEADKALGQPLADLETYALGMGVLVDRLEKRLQYLRENGLIGETHEQLMTELERGLRLTALRACHRALTLKALQAKRKEQARSIDHYEPTMKIYLTTARQVRLQARALMQRQEAGYRYPLQLLAGKRDSLTAYPFGYLYPASQLFFWEREERQVELGRFDPLFMNIWSVHRTLGLESLLFR